MASFKTGDKVQLASREVTPEDEKNGLYYKYFGGLTGTVDMMYDDGSACIDIDLESLSEEARDRHIIMQEAERKRWVDGLSGEARNRLTPEQKQLKLSYKILVSKADLEPCKGGKPGGGKHNSKAAQSASEDDSSSADKGPARAPEPEQAQEPISRSRKAEEDESSPRRPSVDDLARAEEEYLKSLQNK